MKLTVFVEDNSHDFEIPDNLVKDAEDFFKKMDNDMDKGYQMSSQWIEKPNQLQRCQIAADKMMSAIHNENEKMFMLMAAYILKYKPATKEVHLDSTGDISSIDFIER